MPTNGSTSVATSSTVIALFSELMNPSTITTSTFTLTGPGGAGVAGTISFPSGEGTAEFTPSANLAYSTEYTATITTGAQSMSGVALTANYSWSFTTAAAPAPTVTAVTPANLSTGVAITSAVTATFSEAMNAATITGSTFTLTPQGGSAISATVTYSSTGNIATLMPNSVLANNTTYTAAVTTGATSSQGTALAANYTWQFTTATAPAPTVTANTPTGTGVAVSTNLTATFSVPMNISTITSATFTLTGPGNTAVQGVVTAGSTTSTFTPQANLAYNTAYTATITTGATSEAGIPLAANYSWSFTTEAAPVPTVTADSPTGTSVAVGTDLTATFSQPMNSNTINTSTFTLTGPGNTSVAGAVTYNSGTSTATFTPNASLAYSTQYTATITTGATSSAGAALASNYSWNFTTGSNPNVVTVNFATSYQTIRGFGGSTAWLGQLTTQQASALYSASSGLGLSILRVRIDPEGSSTTTPPYVTGEWTQELTNAQEAIAANPNAIVFASPWTPPPAMKLSSTSQPFWSGSPGCGTGGTGSDYCGGYLNPADYAAYASYLEDFVSYFAAGNPAVDLYAISMQNEPDYPDVDYESCYWTPLQMDQWIDSLPANPFGATKLIMPESYDFSVSQAQTAMSDTTAEPLIGILAGHLYGVTPTSAYYNLAQAGSGQDVWMTEHSLTPSGAQPAMSDALTMAEEIHNSMTVGYYNAYVWWWIWDDPNDGVNYGLISSSTTSPAPTYYGYAIGQFSKFIQPGFVRVSATANPLSGVYVSAYDYTGNVSYSDHNVIVVINSNSSAESLSFTLSGGNSTNITSLTPYETSSTVTLAAQTAVSVTGGQFNYTLPAESIVTFVQ
jgi:O-glycosyl hydrolase